MTDWSGGRFGGPNPVGGSDAVDPAADRWQSQASPPGPWEHQQPPAAGPWQQHQPLQNGWGSPPPPVGVGWHPQPAGPAPIGPPLPGPPPGWSPSPGLRKSRKPLWVTLAAGGAVLVVVAIVLVITLAGGGSSGGGGSAGDMVKGYLQALARGDAETALSYGADQPATKELLTSEILKKQIAQWPISNIRILSDDSTGAGAAVGFAQVHVVVNFGDKVSDTTLSVKKDHGSWKLPSAAIKVKPGIAGDRDAAGKTVTFFGKPVGDSTVYVFPGWIDVGTSNPYITVTAKPILLDQVSLISETWIQPTFVLSDKGRDAARDQLVAAMANCQKSNLLAPPGCPMSVDPYGLADGTAAWGPADISAVKFDSFDPYRLALMFFGEAKAPITVRTTGGATKQGEASQFLSGTADLAKTPPELKFR
ncbi:DUF4878 domain-containing protein [Mycobacterium persicum]|uniref:DUF4878 domain-containing protein n=1 Tax=Mycobacterium persicum TaxID=1487726 RepID=UPI0015944891|nr:DUF4878 domain-containing protein [Mycobacterium persicum]